jgi:endonuclease YncB( thermonuclease family)
LVQFGAASERGISRTKAVVGSLILLLFPLCCTLTVGYRLIAGEPPDFPAMFDTVRTETAGLISGEDETPGPSDTVQAGASTTDLPDDQTPSPSETLPMVQLPACIPENAARQVGTVKEVMDGDEIRVQVGEDQLHVRYIGMLAPELSENYGPKASNQNVELVLLKQVTLVRDVTDRNPDGSYPRYVVVGEVFVNRALVRQGLAYAENTPPDLACSDTLQQAEAEAKNEGVGLWETAPGPTDTLLPTWTAAPDETDVTCDCKGPDLDCDDFENVTLARLCYVKCFVTDGDVFDLDADENGIACDE